MGHPIGNQTQGSLTSGIILGLVYGFVFTFVPLLIVWQARYKKISWPWKGVIVVVAVLLAIPNLLTLSIYANSSSAATKARSMIDIERHVVPVLVHRGCGCSPGAFPGHRRVLAPVACPRQEDEGPEDPK